MNALWERIKREPVLLSVFVSDALALAIQFGVNISDARLQAITTILSSFMLLMGGAAISRSKVVPLKSVVTYKDSKGSIVS
jgi:hypothetical protein